MNPAVFVQALSAVALPNVFNPYGQRCEVHDKADAPALRRRNLRSYLQTVLDLGVDTIWMGRDLGYRGGRRTGLALTDEYHLPELSAVYPGAESARSTRGLEVKERTATEIWAMLHRLDTPPLLWNVFPFHPHEPDQPFTNRRFTAKELAIVDGLNAELFSGWGIKRVVSIGQDAASYATKFGVEVLTVRHPSYGGVADFRQGLAELYQLRERRMGVQELQSALF